MQFLKYANEKRARLFVNMLLDCQIQFCRGIHSTIYQALSKHAFINCISFRLISEGDGIIWN